MIVRSKHIIPEKRKNEVEGTIKIPDLTVQSRKKLNKISIIKVEWNYMNTLGFTLSNGESCTAGQSNKVSSHTFDQNKKITKVECIMWYDEKFICRMNFYSGQETIVKVGWSDGDVKRNGRRVESFEIADDESLIGCELDFDSVNFCGVTWLKRKNVQLP
jgi:hypothetical protein